MNPLTWMRENQHRMLVFFTVMLMAGFGALTVMSSNAPRNPVVDAKIEAKPAVVWSNGTFTDIQLQDAWRRRLALQVFLSKLLAAAQRIDPNYTSDEPLMLGPPSPEDVPAQARQVETFNVIMLAQKARDLGVQVSDDTIDIKLKRFVNVLSLNDMRAIATEVGRDAGMMSYTDFRELLKREFLARQTFLMGIEAGMPRAVNPAAAFSYYARINRRFDCQVLELKVEDYLSKVTETPSDNELRSLFAEGRYRYPTFDGSKPGFKIGNRLKLEYFVADTQAVLNRLAAEIPAEEVRAEYDRLLAEKDPLVYTPPPAPPSPLGLDPTSFPSGLGESVPLDGPKTDAPTNTPPANSGDLNLPPTVPPTNPGDLELPPAVPPTTEAPPKQGSGNGESGEQATDTKPTEVQSGNSEGSGGNSEASGGNTEGSDTEAGDDGKRQFVSLRIRQETGDVQEPGGAKESQETQETKEAEGSQGTQSNQGEQGSPGAQDPPTTTPPTQEQPPAATTPPTQDQPPAEATPPTQEPPVVQTPPPAEPKIRTFEETEQEIRRRLAAPKAMAQVKAGFDDITKQLRIFRSDYRIHQANPKTEPEAQPIDFAALAKKHQFIYNVTPVIDQATLQKTPLGSIGAPQSSFANELFGNFDRLSQDPFAAIQVDADTLVWITESFPARAGEFDEVREQVLDYWKMGKARELALADAKAKASQVGEGQELKVVHPAAVETGAFSWFTSDMFSQGMRISRVNGTETVGEEFMEAATSLGIGKTTTAFNADRSRVYVIYKTANSGQSDDELMTQFLTSVGSFNDYPFQVRSVLQQREFQAGTTFLENLRDEYEVNFVE